MIYSLATGGTISIISLFMAGVVPGLLLGFSLILLCLVHGLPQRPPARRAGAAAPGAARSRVDAFWGLITLVIILGGILGGVFTAVEAGAVACVWAFFVTMFIYRDYRWRRSAGAGAPHVAHGGDGDDADRLRRRRSAT